MKKKIAASYRSFKLIWSLNKKYIIVVFCSELIKSLKILPYIYLLQISVSTLLDLDDFDIYAVRITALLAAILLLELLSSLLKKTRSQEEASLDFQIRQEFIEKNDTIDYYTLSTRLYPRTKLKFSLPYSRLSRIQALIRCSRGATSSLLSWRIRSCM